MMSRHSCLLLVLAATVAVSCSQLPQTQKTTEEMAGIRAEYLENNPDGKYTDYVLEGRIVKGMTTLDVLASWGLPNARRNWNKDDAEYWTYYARDEHTQQVVSYDLVFQEKMLTRWVVAQELGTSLGSAVNDPSVRTVEETLRLGTAQAATESAASKKN